MKIWHREHVRTASKCLHSSSHLRVAGPSIHKGSQRFQTSSTSKLYLIYQLFQFQPRTTNSQATSQPLRRRHLTLFALSQTCRSLRRVFLRYLWQRIEVYNEMDTGNGPLPSCQVSRQSRGVSKAATGFINKKYATELVRQLEIVTIRDPSLAEHVNFVNVLVVEYSVETVLQELARCIAQFPNLHTVQLNFAFNVTALKLTKTFTPYKYPQIRNVSIILPSCPGVRRVTPYQSRTWDSLLHTEVLGLLKYTSTTIKDMVQSLPNLRDVTLDADILRKGFQHIQQLSKLRRLQTIRIKLNGKQMVWSYQHIVMDPASKEEIKEWMEWAQTILSSIPDDEKLVRKKVIVTRVDGKVETRTL
ncbi:hypothetical protein BDZ97DRAFT_1781415 [Flammula alnicola]|nr:hypothetical protein BDZ97DRAFT_1781415 [Flammula alnicola]